MTTNGTQGYVYNSGGCGFTCGRTGLAAGVGTPGRANQLGFVMQPVSETGGVLTAARAATVATAATAATSWSCGPQASVNPPCGSCCVPAAYETPTLCGYLGSLRGLEEGLIMQDVVPVLSARIVRATTAPTGFTYAIGVAVNGATGQATGFLTVLGPGPVPVSGAPPAPVLPTVALEFTQASGNVLRLTHPRALVARGPGWVTVVGTGTVTDFNLDVTVQPMLCHVCVGGAVLGTPYCIAGNGATTVVIGTDDPVDIIQEDYYDVAVNPCDPCSLYVCGAILVAANGTIIPFASVRVVRLDTGLSTAVNILAPFVLLPLGPSIFSYSVAVSLVVQPSLGLVTMGVNGALAVGNTARSTLWSVAAVGLAAVAPGPAPATAINTLYNSPSTGLLGFGAQPIASTVIVRVLAAPTGGLAVVGRVGLEDTPDLPAVAVGVWAFGPTTAPDVGFGADGVAVWSVPDGGATVATLVTDAALTADSSAVVLVGDAFAAPAAEGDAGFGGPLGIVYPSLPYLDTLEAVPSGLNASQPFGFIAVASLIGCPSSVGAVGGAVCVPNDAALCGPCRPGVATVTWCLPGCAEARLVTAVALSGPLGARVTGDVFRRVGCPAQPAGVLDVGVALLCVPRITNSGPGTWVGATPGTALAAPPDGGPLRVDYCAPAPSTLMVSGPIIVGGPCGVSASAFSTDGLPPPSILPIPGTMYFDKAAQKLYVCVDGETFQEVVLVPPPP
jgi:hypothetical protein